MACFHITILLVTFVNSQGRMFLDQSVGEYTDIIVKNKKELVKFTILMVKQKIKFVNVTD